MDASTISGLINFGAAGAVIIVVILFLRSNKERDEEWRSFFTALNANNKEDVTHLAEMMERLVEAVDCIKGDLVKHDEKVDQRIATIQRKTRPVKE